MRRHPTRYKEVDIPVIDGTAYLPDGRTVESNAQVVRVPVLLGNRLYESIRRFKADVRLPGEAARRPEAFEAEAMRLLILQLDRDLTGPRGGRYVPFGPTVFQGIAEVGNDFIRNEATARAWRMARYVRPLGRQ